jgi:hypothetical protein
MLDPGTPGSRRSSDVQIKCGSTQIDGNAFCMGVKQSLVKENDAGLWRLISSITWLIHGALFRSRYDIHKPSLASPDTAHIGSLLDMYHGHKATIVVTRCLHCLI